MKNVRKLGVSSVLTCLILISNVAQAYSKCSAWHCHSIQKILDEFCIDNGYNHKPFLVQENGVFCECTCGCVSKDTLISSDQGYLNITKLEPGNRVLTPRSQEGSALVAGLIGGQFQDQTVINIDFENGSRMSVSNNHTFISPQERVVRADELHEGESVLDENGVDVKISSIRQKPYTGKMYNFVVNGRDGLIEDHVVATNGILSGDWYVQTLADSVEYQLELRMNLVYNSSL